MTTEETIAKAKANELVSKADCEAALEELAKKIQAENASLTYEQAYSRALKTGHGATLYGCYTVAKACAADPTYAGKLEEIRKRGDCPPGFDSLDDDACIRRDGELEALTKRVQERWGWPLDQCREHAERLVACTGS